MPKNTKLWGGRFAEATNRAAERFSASVHYDKRLYLQDILGSIAHAKMLAKVSIISSDEADQIEKGLLTIREEIKDGTFSFHVEREDIHMNIEARLIELIGPTGEKVHTARSRNDQVANDLRMYLKGEIDNIGNCITSLQQAFLDRAEQYQQAIMPGFTHLQHAQPILVAHHLLAYVEMLERDKQRFADARKRIDILVLGACAFAGTPLPIDRTITAKLLGFAGVARNSIDAVSDRDFVAEILSAIAVCGVHLSRWCEELVIWCSSEYSFVTLADSFCTGSSIMPQKKNPDMAELIRGKTGRLNGNLVSILTTMKGLPLSYNRDLQEDKEPLFDSIDTLKGMLTICAGMTQTLTFNEKIIKEAANSDFILATEIADYLVLKHIPFRKAHEIVGNIVAYCIEKNKKFKKLTIEQWKSFSDVFDSDIKEILSVEQSIAHKRSLGSTSADEVARQIEHWNHALEVL